MVKDSAMIKESKRMTKKMPKPLIPEGKTTKIVEIMAIKAMPGIAVINLAIW